MQQKYKDASTDTGDTPSIGYSGNGKTLVWIDYHAEKGGPIKGCLHVYREGTNYSPIDFVDSWNSGVQLAISPEGERIAVASIDSKQRSTIRAYQVEKFH